jgi:hypothetical protein
VSAATDAAKLLIAKTPEKLSKSMKQSVHRLQQEASAKASKVISKMKASALRIHPETTQHLGRIGASRMTALLQDMQKARVKTLQASQNIMAESSRRIQSSIHRGAKSIKYASSSAVATLDPRARVRQWCNRILLIFFSGIFVYGFATSLPSAITAYTLEREERKRKGVEEKK